MEVELDKEVFTTFEAAKICNANITSIKNWIDKGELRAFRTPGGHYRIERKVLDDFLNRHAMPNPFAERKRRRVLYVHNNPTSLEEISSHFGEQYDYEATDDPQQALLTIGQWVPDAVVIDDRIPGIELRQLCETIADNIELRPVSVVALHERDDGYSDALREAGCKYVVTPPDDTQIVIETLRRALL
ncbi:MAG: helix-turn-helix domain-containing protein [Persicimonas sp.]